MKQASCSSTDQGGGKRPGAWGERREAAQLQNAPPATPERRGVVYENRAPAPAAPPISTILTTLNSARRSNGRIV